MPPKSVLCMRLPLLAHGSYPLAQVRRDFSLTLCYVGCVCVGPHFVCVHMRGIGCLIWFTLLCSQDGSYNKTIPAQHDELLNCPVHALSPRKKMPSDASGNGLCRKCNINQELKVQQLAMFTPINPAHDDEELDEYRYVCPHSLSLNVCWFIARVLHACHRSVT
jgi:hypothetical protein